MKCCEAHAIKDEACNGGLLLNHVLHAVGAEDKMPWNWHHGLANLEQKHKKNVGGQQNASAGIRTRVAAMATLHDTPTLQMLVENNLKMAIL